MQADGVRFGFDGERFTVRRNPVNFQGDAEHHPNRPAPLFTAKVKNCHEPFPSVNFAKQAPGPKALCARLPRAHILSDGLVADNGMSVPPARATLASTDVPMH